MKPGKEPCGDPGQQHSQQNEGRAQGPEREQAWWIPGSKPSQLDLSSLSRGELVNQEGKSGVRWQRAL